LILTTTCFTAAQRTVDPETRFRDALHKQQVEGDLNGAIEIYREIAASGAASRPLKARALLQLATSLETLGQQAEAVYQRILKEFDDQPAASQAKTRLAALKPPAPAGVTLTQIRFGAGVQNVVATDSQRAIYWNTDRTTLFIGDVAGKTRKEIFRTTPNRRPRVEPSRDLSMVFLYFLPTEQSPATSYAVIRTDGSGGYREVNLDEKGYGGTLSLSEVTWSFDNRYVLLCQREKDGIIRPLKLSVEDGQIVSLLPGHPTNIGYAVLSPDGKYIAWHEWRNGPLGVYIKPIQGGEIQTIAQRGFVGDWSQDGQNLLFGADEKDVPSLYTIRVQEGRAIGDRTFVGGLREEVGSRITRAATVGNSLIYAKTFTSTIGRRIYRASLDAEGRLSEWTVLKTPSGQPGENTFPVSSPDGTKVAYRTGPLSVGGPSTSTVRVHTVATGEDRELFLSDTPILNCVWASQSSLLYCGQPLPEGKTAILSIDTATGRAEKLASFPGRRAVHPLSPDDRTLYMYNLYGPTNWPRWEIGKDQEIPGPQNAPYTSADGSWAMIVGTDAAQRQAYQIRPASAGDDAWKHVAYRRKQAPDPRGLISHRFSPDGNWLVYHDLDSDDKDALFRVSTSGGEPQRLGNYPISSPNSWLSVSLDGRYFLVEADNLNLNSMDEHWILQNFLTKP
jgi:Tol biopolymer transport system component